MTEHLSGGSSVPSLALSLLALGCTDPKDSPGKDTAPWDSGDTAELFEPATGSIGKVRQAEDVFHPSVHLFTNYQSERTVQEEVAAIKENLLGDRAAATCYTNGSETVQFALQTEYIPEECSTKAAVEDCFETLDQRLDALTSAGLPVHLLLSVHQVPRDGWLGVNWSAEQSAFSNASTFMPFKPSLTDEDGPYDVLSEQWQVPTIDHLVSTGRTENLAMIYVANEFGYISGGEEASDQAAMAATVTRLLDNARTAAAGTVPVGVKFARLSEPSTGWTPNNESDPDQLQIVAEAMAAQGDVLGYDIYINNGNSWDSANHDRLAPFMSGFPGGNVEISEFGRECEEGDTTSADYTDTLSVWTEARGINAFGWNASNCYGMTEGDNAVTPEGAEVLEGLRDAGAQFLGVSDVLTTPCPE